MVFMEQNLENYKVIIISGPDDDAPSNDGEILYTGSMDDYAFHIDCLIDYAVKKYPNVQVFKQINDRCEPDVPAFFLTVYGDIVYLNTSSGRYGNSGMFFMPDEISKKQFDSLNSLAKVMKNVSVSFLYDLHFDDGIVEGKELLNDGSQSFSSMVNKYLTKINQTSKNKKR